MDDWKLSQEQVACIETHCDYLIDAAETALANLRTLPVALQTGAVAGQIKWWKHAIAAMTWSKGQARQRLRIEKHVARKAIQ